MTNYILLQGLEMYVAIFLFIGLFLLGSIGFLTSIYSDNESKKYKSQLDKERKKNIELNHENMYLKLKYGELEVGE